MNDPHRGRSLIVGNGSRNYSVIDSTVLFYGNYTLHNQFLAAEIEGRLLAEIAAGY
ncbi:MAG: hypothetical protein ACD_75C01365G0002 [uncultured bacterium]|nr:MAG: hypothetical protein ACD_75C01365G0002 [uncultured bacterium]